MKRNDLIKLVQECYCEVISEESPTTTSAKEKEKQEREQWLKAKKTTTDAELNDLKKSTTNISENDLEEMARIPTKYSLSDDANIESLKGIDKKVAEFIRDNPGSTRLQITHGLEKGEPAAITPSVRTLVSKGIVKDEGLVREPNYKSREKLSTGLRGRKITPEGAKKRAVKSIYNKLMNGDEDSITFEETELIGDEKYKEIKELVAQGGVKLGRKSKEDKHGMFYQQDEFNEPDEFAGENFDIEPDENFEEPEIDELTQLINMKDRALTALKKKKITLIQFKKELGDIPKRIKQLQGRGDEEVTDDDLFENNYLMERMKRIANIK